MTAVRYRNWVAPKRKCEDFVSLAPARRMLSTLDRNSDSLKSGDPLPTLWHWLYFLPAVPISMLGKDGHQQRGDFMPPVDLPVRMFAGFELNIAKPLTIGERAWRTEQVTKIEEKKGKSSRLLFVTVSSRIENQTDLVLLEKQVFVYREKQAFIAVSPKEESIEYDCFLEVAVTPVLLFRFSALTFNTHRIHYDKDYAVEHEYYPGLVAHGPLVALFMVELISQNSSGRIKQMEFRQHAPLFDGDILRIYGIQRENSKNFELKALNRDSVRLASGWCLID